MDISLRGKSRLWIERVLFNKKWRTKKELCYTYHVDDPLESKYNTSKCLGFQYIPNCFCILIIDLDNLNLCFDIALFPFSKMSLKIRLCPMFNICLVVVENESWKDVVFSMTWKQFNFNVLAAYTPIINFIKNLTSPQNFLTTSKC